MPNCGKVQTVGLCAGASSDLEQATKLARNMVTKYGMSDKVGNISIDYEDDGRSLSSETRSAVEEEVMCKQELHLWHAVCACIICRQRVVTVHLVAHSML